MLQLILNGLTQVSAGTSTRLRRIFAFPTQPVGITWKVCWSWFSTWQNGDVPWQVWKKSRALTHKILCTCTHPCMHPHKYSHTHVHTTHNIAIMVHTTHNHGTHMCTCTTVASTLIWMSVKHQHSACKYSKYTLVLVPMFAKQGCKNLVTHTHTHLQGRNSSASILHWNPVGLPVVCHVKQVVASLALV